MQLVKDVQQQEGGRAGNTNRQVPSKEILLMGSAACSFGMPLATQQPMAAAADAVGHTAANGCSS
jgi:hypothetical protein